MMVTSATSKDTNPKDAIGMTKVALSLLSPIAKAAWSLAQYAGMTKYGAWNWRIAGVRMSIYLDAIDRHRDGLLSGEWYDPIDKTPHLGNIMACCAIILDAKAAGKLIDDRPPSVDMRSTYAEVEATMAELRDRATRDGLQPRHYTIADTIKPTLLPPVHASIKCPPDSEPSIQRSNWQTAITRATESAPRVRATLTANPPPERDAREDVEINFGDDFAAPRSGAV